MFLTRIFFAESLLDTRNPIHVPLKKEAKIE